MTITRREWILGTLILGGTGVAAARAFQDSSENQLELQLESRPGPQGEQCEDCYFYHSTTEEERRRYGYSPNKPIGFCRFNPPAGGRFLNTTRADHWCSKFKELDKK